MDRRPSPRGWEAARTRRATAGQKGGAAEQRPTKSCDAGGAVDGNKHRLTRTLPKNCSPREPENYPCEFGELQHVPLAAQELQE